MKNAFTCYLQYIFWGETLLWATFNPQSLIASELVYIEHQVHFLCNFGSVTGASSNEKWGNGRSSESTHENEWIISWREQPVRDWQETIIYWDWQLLTAWGRREEGGGGVRGFCLCHDKIYLNPPATVRFHDIRTTLSPLSPPPIINN